MNESILSRVVDFMSRLLQGGTFELVLFVILVVLAILIAILLVFIAWKLIVLLAKGLLWIIRALFQVGTRQRAAARAARLTQPPRVGTNWHASSRIGYRAALRQAERQAHADAYRILVIAGDGAVELCEGLGCSPPGAGVVGIAASEDVILIDASRVSRRELRKLLGALPWRRPFDAVVAMVKSEEVAPETLSRAAFVARLTGLRVAMHLVFGTASPLAVWQIVDATHRDGGELCSLLAEDAARAWLAGGSRTGLNALTASLASNLPASLDRLFSATPSSLVDVASVAFGGAGMRAAVAQTAGRTRPSSRPGLALAASGVVLAAGIGAGLVGCFVAMDSARELRAMLTTAVREAAAPVLPVQGSDADALLSFPDGGRVLRLAGLGLRLSHTSDFSPLAPGRFAIPNARGPVDLGAAFLKGYVLTPLARALDVRARRLLEPIDDPERWLQKARTVEAWVAAWEGLADDPGEVDVPRLLADAFGGDPNQWPEGVEVAIVETGIPLPLPSEGGLDTHALLNRAQENFVITMQLWAEKHYTNGPLARAARTAMDRSLPWRDQHDALRALRAAVQDPGQAWVTASEDRPDYEFELRQYAQAVAIALLGQSSAVSAKAEVSRIRLDAREAADRFLVPELGPLLGRSGAAGGDGRGPLTLSPAAAAWLAFMDRARAATFGRGIADDAQPLAGPVTVDPASVSAVRRKLGAFDRFTIEVPENLPPTLARGLAALITSDVVLSVPAEVEHALRPAPSVPVPVADALRLARLAPALSELEEIETWLLDRGAKTPADRVREVRLRTADHVLEAGLRVLEEQDPLGFELASRLDADLLRRRFDRGTVALQQVLDEYAIPFLDSGAAGGTLSAFDWQAIAQDVEAQGRGDPASTLASLEYLVHAYAADRDEVCREERSAGSGSRSDYLARAFYRFRDQVEASCEARERTRIASVYQSLHDFYEREIVWRGPYSPDPAAPDLPASTLSQFVSLLQAAAADLYLLEGPHADLFRESARFWTLDESGTAAVRFRARWRTRPSEEHLAENLIAIHLEGVSRDEDGVHTWRYSAPAALVLRLANTSVYRFVNSEEPGGLTFRFAGSGNDSLLPLLFELSSGAGLVRGELLRGDGVRDELRLSARIGAADGSPLAIPAFGAAAPRPGVWTENGWNDDTQSRDRVKTASTE